MEKDIVPSLWDLLAGFSGSLFWVGVKKDIDVITHILSIVVLRGR